MSAQFLVKLEDSDKEIEVDYWNLVTTGQFESDV